MTDQTAAKQPHPAAPWLHLQAATRIRGIAVRTQNACEFDPGNAKLPTLWARFFNEGIAQKVAPPAHSGQPLGTEGGAAGPAGGDIYGVYSHYESDFNGHYSVTAGMAQAVRSDSLGSPPASADPALTKGDAAMVDILAGQYLVFEARGAMPGAVVAAWQQVWAYFQVPGPWARCYGTDFECYQGPEQARVCIGVVSAG
jgi:predicted transcriptional regulator YdeE